MAIKYSRSITTASAMIVSWLVFAYLFMLLKTASETAMSASVFSLVGEVGLDLVLVIFSFLFWRRSQLDKSSSVFFMLFLSFMSAGVADAIYNLLLNIYKFEYLDTIGVSLFDIPFASFLFFQCMAWLLVLLFNRKNEYSHHYSYLPYFVISISLLIMFVFVVKWRINYLSIIGLFQLLDTFLEVLGFGLATVCMARASTSLIRYLSTGYLLVISADFIIRYNVISGVVPYLNSFEVLWVLGLVLIVHGFITSSKDLSVNSLKLLPINSLQAQVSAWLLVLWLISMFAFMGFHYLLANNYQEAFGHLSTSFVLMLVPFTVLIVASSNLISTMISQPLAAIGDIVNKFIFEACGDFYALSKSKIDNNYINEFQDLERFVYQAIELSNEKYFLEKKYSQFATQIVHDIRSPLASLRLITASLDFIPRNQKDAMETSLERISEISDSLLSYHRSNVNKLVAIEIYPLVSLIVDEKRRQHYAGNIKIDFNALEGTKKLKAVINPVDFKRVISNLISNSIDAINDSGFVKINLTEDLKAINIDITDSGCGIPEMVLSNIENGISVGKLNGNGLGLSHAVKCIRDWGGNYFICSSIEYGTKFSIMLNKSL